ncbi:condensation domain-containing protein [Paenibacillus sp. Dod16]|uniref:condensation domain-containing protein n=1 Tax=Paenibacillus sp. Dod16 TaxID=3416392 RepID=UPI003CEE23C5
MYHNLTHAQKRIWITDRIYHKSPMHNIGGCLKITGHVDWNKMVHAVNDVIQFNDSLRIRLIEIDGEPYQYIHDYSTSVIEFLDFSGHENAHETFEKWVEEFFRSPFELEDKELFQFVIYKLSEVESGLVLKIHHIISDGWSVALIQKQIFEKYNNSNRLKPALELSYIDYIKKERKYLESIRFLKDQQFWSNKLEHLPETSLYKNLSNLECNRMLHSLDELTSQKINSLIKELGISLNIFFITAFLIYLHKTLGENDIIIGTPVLNRGDYEDKQTIGMYVSTMPLRVGIEDKQSIFDFIKIIVREIKRCYIHQKYPYDLLIKDLQLVSKGYDSLFKYNLNYYNTRFFDESGELQIEAEEYTSRQQNLSLQLTINQWNENKILLGMDYKIEEYKQSDIKLVYQHLETIWKQMLYDPQMKIKDIKLLSKEEIINRIYTLNQNTRNYPQDKTIIQHFEEQVEKEPNKEALINNDTSLTYSEVNQRANQLARFLISKGVEKGDIVSIYAYHSYELVIAILGILKAGAAYLPIDPDYPHERINFMLQDSKSRTILTNISLSNNISFDGEIIDLLNQSIYTLGKSNLSITNSPEDVVYIIYTSGSTGMPKGVIIEHRNLLNYILWARNTYVGDNEAFALYSSIAFDLTVTTIFTPLVSGSRMIIYKQDEQEFILYRILEDNKATIVKLTPSHLSLIKNMNNRNSSVKKFIVGGENLKVTIANEVDKSFDGNIEIFNERVNL